VTVANSVDRPLGGPPALDGRYRAGRRLGGGSGGETYAAEDTTTGVACVVKMFAAPSAAASEEFRQLLALAHPSVVRVRHVGRTADGRPFLVTDLVPGAPLVSLAAVLDEAKRSHAFARAARELTDALAHLHARGVVHGDVCSANVRFDAAGRAVLLDFGLAGPPTLGWGGARGTLGYAAPEALTGARTVAADLFGLGATLFEAWTGATPFGRGLSAAQRMLTSRAPRLSSVRGGLPEAWDGLLERLLAPEPRARPASARQLLRELGRIIDGAETSTVADLGVPHPEGDPLEGLFVGRAGERGLVRVALERLAEGAATHAVVAVVGPPGSGRRTLIDGAERELAIAVAAGVSPDVRVVRGDVAALERLVGEVPGARDDGAREDGARALQQRLARLVDGFEREARTRPLCVILDEGPLSEALATFVAGAPPAGRVALIVPTRVPLERPFAENVVLQPLEDADVVELVTRASSGEPIPAAALVALVASARGHAALVAVLARRLVARLRTGVDAAATLGAFDEPGAELDDVLARELSALNEAAREAVVALALSPGSAPELAGHDEATWRASLTAARAAGWARRTADGAPELASTHHRRVALAALAAPGLATVARRAASTLAADDPLRARALVALDRRAEASASLRALAARAAEEGDDARAASWLDEAAALDPQALTAHEHVVRAMGLGALGRYPAAALALDDAAHCARDAGARALVVERRAWLLARTGDVRAAATTLDEALAAGGDVAAFAPVRARLGRVLVTAGRFGEALAALAPLEAAGAPVPALAVEAAILARAYLGDFAGARAQLAGPDGVRAATGGRRAYLEGLIAQLAGEGDAARAHYRRAVELSAARGEVHTLASVALNLGALLAEQGTYGEALAATERAVRALGQLGATAELGTALVNAANLLVQLGDLTGARRALERARVESARRGVALVEALVSFVEGDLARREGRLDTAVASYAAASRRFVEVGQPRRAVSAALSGAEAHALAGRPSEAARALDEALSGAHAEDDVESWQARVRVALAGGADAGTLSSLAARAEALAGAAAARGLRPVAWRLAATTALLHHRSADAARAARLQSFARTTFEEIRMATPEHHRPGLDADPDARWLSRFDAGGTAASSDVALATRAAETEARLRRLLRINKRLNSELRLPRLLETIVDTVIELTDAERGFLLLEDDAGELVVKVARNIDQKTLETAEFDLSRSIARQAAAGGEPIVTLDAAGDTRFKEALSVSDLHLRSVIAVPLVVKGRAVGTIYADHRLRKGAFDDDDVKVVLDFAEQAAIAIENARLLGELRRRERQVEALNRRLEVELAARREELSGIKQELLQNREALAVRYDYRNIVGRTPRMLELFRLLDRLTDTSLPVVIQGESGTGKELVARAIHFNGPRKAKPFVSENCAAIPETLLESTLFGYVRGAFTGAERDTRGLYEIADGGTLFLDEIGEMSPALQGKLLRVLQEGEFRRVGGERTRKVDVRIVAATNRDLARMVEEGKFRQDLYFRLNVARIQLPPLRDRREDIPSIVEHFLAKRAAEEGRPAPKPLEAGVLARLVAHRWPGNVRELENEITRAHALSGAIIMIADLSPAVAAAGDAGPTVADDPDSLALKPRVERLERSLLREALGRCGNNQTKAAELLGLSRFGLQKKLKRYRFS
jgi:transcriptional regulator with GAF, ATPase, and Fis domain/tetratricopeptide (TPR) repeat protein